MLTFLFFALESNVGSNFMKSTAQKFLLISCLAMQLFSTCISITRFFVTKDFFGNFWFGSNLCPPLTIEISPKNEISECLRAMTWNFSNSIVKNGWMAFLELNSSSIVFFVILQFYFQWMPHLLPALMIFALAHHISYDVLHSFQM